VRCILFARPGYSEVEHEFVHDVCYRLARRALATGRTTVLDATNLRAQHRQRYRDLARAHQIPCHLVVVDTHEQTIRARLKRRSCGEAQDGSEATETAYELLRRTTEPVNEPHLRVRGDGDVRPAAQAVLALLWTEGATVAPTQHLLPTLAVASAGA
jgi:predicted kinase